VQLKQLCSLAPLVFVFAACTGDTEGDAGGVDASVVEAGARDAGGADADPRDAGPEDAGPGDAGPPVVGTAGTITYDRRPVSGAGLGAAISDPVEGALVALVVDGAEVARTNTDAGGEYAFDEEPTGAVEVRVLAASEDPPVSVGDLSGNTYAFVVPLGAAHVPEAEFAGALAQLDTLRDGLRFAQTAFERTERFPPLGVRWERGRSTPGGTSYATGDVLWILGGPTDTDEYDVSVILHELGHYLQWVYPFSDSPPGPPHAGADTDPRLAWNEGWPSFFAAVALGQSSYRDTVGSRTAIDLDLATLPFSGEYVGQSGGTMRQTLSEWLIAASLYHLYTSGDEATQRPRSFAPLTGWLGDRGNDRGVAERDFVDFLDGYLCLNADADRDRIAQHVVMDRSFPYDLSPPCPKPGRAPVASFREPPPVALPGRVIVDATGRSLREIRVSESRTRSASAPPAAR